MTQTMKRLDSTGFTLLELLISLSIVTILIAIVPPMVTNVIDSSKVKAATRELVSVLKVARELAMANQEEATFLIDVNAKSYKTLKHSRSLLLPDGSTMTLTTAESERLSDSQGNIRFFPDGSSTGGQITFDYKAQQFTIDINWLTSRIRVLP